MLNIFRRVTVYFKVYRNRIEITNLQNGETISKRPLVNFSSSRMLIADFNIAQELCRTIIQELGLSKRPLKILIQQMEKLDGGVSESEKRILRDTGEQVGGVSVKIEEGINILSYEEAIAIIEKSENHY